MFRTDPLAHPEALIRRVYAYVAYRIGEGADAEAVTSETFERALRYRRSYDHRRGEPLAWLMGIARRCVDDAHRTLATSTREADDSSQPGDLEEKTVERLAIRGAVSKLDDRDRELIALRYGADLTSRQIGELLQLTPNAVDVAIHRALAKLRTELEATQPAA